MTISEIRKEKSNLDEAIGNLVRNFEAKTQLTVKSIDIYRSPMYTGMMQDAFLLVTTKVEI